MSQRSAKTNNLKPTAHALIWQGQAPSWMPQIPTPVTGSWWTDPVFLSNCQYMKQYISAAMKQVIQLSAGDPNYFHSIFFVNEFVDPYTIAYNSVCYSGGPFQPAGVNCTQSVPANYMGQIFQYAAQYNTYWSQQLGLPKTNAKFGINETGAETDQFGALVQQGILSVVQAMKSFGVQLDAVGLECHLQPQMMNNPYEPDWTNFGNFIQQLGNLGVEVHLTELDVLDYENGCWGSAQRSIDSDNLTSAYYSSFLQKVLSYTAVKSVCFWDFSDRYSFYRTLDESTWFGYNSITNPKPTSNPPRCYIMPSAANVTCARADFYDDQMVAKIGRQSISNALSGAPTR